MRNPIMVGDRVYLRPEEPGDAETMALHYARETDDWIDDFGRYPVSPITIRQAIEEDSDTSIPDMMTLHSCLIEDDQLIGRVGLFGIDYVNGTAETFSHFAPGPWRGKGYGTESKHLLLEYCFDTLQLHILQSYVFGSNERSAAALRRQGYQPAGILRLDGPRRGKYLDTWVFDIKRDEWLAARDDWRQRRQRASQPTPRNEP